ncbi:MAG: IS3 family transposase [Pseudomonadota bacterium]
MSKYRTAYAPEFRQQLIELVHAGRSANDVAKEFGLHATTVAKWVRLSPMGMPAAVPSVKSNVPQGPLNAAERQELVELRRKLRQVQMERDILAKANGLVCRQKREDVHNVYQLVKANQAQLPVRALCETLKVSTSGYYDWRDRPLSQRGQDNVVLSESIRQAHRASDETYGMPRIRAELVDAGINASRKRIARLMRAMRIQGVSRRRAWCATTKRNKSQRPAPDLVKRVFVSQAINELWVADMTYVPTWEGFLYLAVVTDACSRKVVGWAFGVQMTADLVISALNMALHSRRPESVIHHSDQGSQYTSIAFGNRCREMGVRPSMGTVGDAYDNAMAESFFATLECELIARRSWRTKTEARLAVFTWIESWYNPHRRHSALNYLSPNNFERKHQENTINTETQKIPELQ